ncbi:G-protein-signaling modulator 2 isoform X2 [Planococcus citri]|uniref:G-protein-signaling modulator 2 isoform X2 n=1 Tax=Planococcus citri TaxID=170843 RepID=UPI0031F89008
MASKDEENSSSTENQNYTDSGNMCLELALEGERLCKSGDCRAGVAFFQAAIQAGTEDLRTLSAIYSQLGNAYFYLGDYAKAVQYHKHDLTLARTMGDKLGEAKSSGNLGNALKVMGKFDEAVLCCKRHLEISQELSDKLSEGRALYNLGNVYHAKGKHIGRVGQQDPGEFSEEVKSCLKQAVKYYEENLVLMKELGDVAAQGRACGNLGNTNYLLGNFQEAIRYHEERLQIAREFGDKAAERRAHSNLGNSHIFLGEFEQAAEHYKKTLSLAQELQDKAVEAQACYSLGNTYTLLHNYTTAIEYHLRHYLIAQQLQDRVGEGRACWSLGNAYTALEDHERALRFAEEHLLISKELGDTVGQATAHVNIMDLKKILGRETNDLSPETAQLVATASSIQASPGLRRYRLTPDGKQGKCTVASSSSYTSTNNLPKSEPAAVQNDDEDNFFDLLSRFQSKRMDDQRCSLSSQGSFNKENQCDNAKSDAAVANGDTKDDLLDLIMGIQSKRMDEQRVELPNLPGLCRSSVSSASDGPATSENRARAGSRLDDRREVLANDIDEEERAVQSSSKASTVPDEDFFSLISRLQSGRMDDQRAKLKK